MGIVTGIGLMSATALARPANAVTGCSYTSYLCFYTGNTYTGEMGKVSGSNSNFTQLGKLGGGTWNDATDSASNDGQYDNAAMWSNAGYTGFDE